MNALQNRPIIRDVIKSANDCGCGFMSVEKLQENRLAENQWCGLCICDNVQGCDRVLFANKEGCPYNAFTAVNYHLCNCALDGLQIHDQSSFSNPRSYLTSVPGRDVPLSFKRMKAKIGINSR